MNKYCALWLLTTGLTANTLTGCGVEQAVYKPIAQNTISIEESSEKENNVDLEEDRGENVQKDLAEGTLDVSVQSDNQAQADKDPVDKETLLDDNHTYPEELIQGESIQTEHEQEYSNTQIISALDETQKQAMDENLPVIFDDSVVAPPMPIINSAAVGYNDRKSWWFKRNSTNQPPSAQQEINISQYDAYYLGDYRQKIIYLTFDEGYENGYTEKILDVLKEKDVKAAFFVTKSYILSEPDLVRRMVNEGHIVGNHSDSHPDMTTKTNEEIAGELSRCAEAFAEVTGQEMPSYFRPPEGVYSIRTLEETQKNGYKTIFWSYAYKDWDVNNQPGKQGAYDMAMNNYHNGAIMLLHAVSQSNTEALGDIIDSLRGKGYRFATLDELPNGVINT